MAPDARPEQLNLVASNLRLASLADDDPALVELRREVEHETGIPAALTDTLIHALRGADHLGSLLKVDAAVDEALERHEAVLGRSVHEQRDFSPASARNPSGSPSAAPRPRPRCSTAWRVSSPATPAATTSASGCAASSSRRAYASCGWPAREPTTWW